MRVRIRKEKVEKYKKEGWKVVKDDFSDTGLNQAARKNAIAHGDLVLVEKADKPVEAK